MDVIEKYGADASSLVPFQTVLCTPCQHVQALFVGKRCVMELHNKIRNIFLASILMNNKGPHLGCGTENVVSCGCWSAERDRSLDSPQTPETIGKVTENLISLSLVAGHILYNFIWDELADWHG